MDRVGMGIAASVVLVFVVDLLWKVFAGTAPAWWLHLADVLVPSLLTIDAVFWLVVGQWDKAILVGLMACFFWFSEIEALRNRGRANEPNG
jgi:hypothetical protein